MALPAHVLPGQVITSSSSKVAPGPGTFLTPSTSTIYASLLGSPETQKSTMTTTSGSSSSSSSSSKNSKILTVAHPSRTPSLPQPASTVYARVARLERAQARLDIIVVNDTVAPQPLRAILRSQDVRATEKDRVKLAECFHVGDVVRATVIGLGDQSGYYLSTAGNEFGVVMAWSEAGNGCVPVSWCEVRDAETGLREARKVAKPV